MQRAYTSMIADRCEVTQADALAGSRSSRVDICKILPVADWPTSSRPFGCSAAAGCWSWRSICSPTLIRRRIPGGRILACRFAWSSEAADLARSYQDMRRPTKARRLEAPLFVQVDDGLQKTAILTGGLPFHRRVGRRMLDTLLIAGGEIQRTFRLGIGVDLKQPFREALGLLLPTLVVQDVPGVATTRSGWLFHLDARNALVTGCQPLLESEHLVGIRLHVVETDGRVQLRLPAVVSFTQFGSQGGCRRTNGQPM